MRFYLFNYYRRKDVMKKISISEYESHQIFSFADFMWFCVLFMLATYNYSNFV